MTTDEEVKPLHQTWKHQCVVSKLHRITNSDMAKLDEFRTRVFQLKTQHEKLWRDYDLYGV